MTATKHTGLDVELIDRVGRLDHTERAALIEMLLEDEPEVQVEGTEYRSYWKTELNRRWENYKSSRSAPLRVEELLDALIRQNLARNS